MEFIQFIAWLALGIFGMAAIISLRSFRNGFPPELKRLSLLWVILFVIDLAGNIMREKGIYNHWLYNIFGWIFYPALAWLYYSKLDHPWVRKIIKGFWIGFPLLVLADTIYIEGIWTLQSLIIVSGGGFIIFLAAAYLRQLYLSDSTENIARDPWFWFSFAFIVYFGVSVPYLGMFNYLWDNYQDFAGIYYYYINISFTILLHALIITGFLCRTNYQKLS